MTYLELVGEWERDLRSRGELVDVKFFHGDGWNDATPEQRAEAFVDMLTCKHTELDTRDL